MTAWHFVLTVCTFTHTHAQTRGPSAPTCLHTGTQTQTHATLARCTELIHRIWNPGSRRDLGAQIGILGRGLSAQVGGGWPWQEAVHSDPVQPVLPGWPLLSSAAPTRLQPSACTWVGFSYSFSHPSLRKNGHIQAACSLTQAAHNPLAPGAQRPEPSACPSIAVPGRRSQFSQHAKTGSCPHGPPTWREGPQPPSALLPPTPIPHLWIPVPGRGSGLRRNHSVSSGSVQEGREGVLQPFRLRTVIRQVTPHPSCSSASPGYPGGLGQDPRCQGGDLPGEGPPGVQQGTSQLWGRRTHEMGSREDRGQQGGWKG